MKITASQIKQNSSLLQKAYQEDIVVTKHEHPFVAIVEYEKYLKMQDALARIDAIETADRMSRAWLASAKESEAVMDEDDKALYEAIEDEAARHSDRA